MTTVAADRVLPTVSRLSPLVIRVLGLNPGAMTLQGTNTYLVGSGAQRLLIDSGQGVPQYAEALKQALHTAAMDAGYAVEVAHVFLTHWHADHTGGTDAVRHLFPQAAFYKTPSAFGPSALEPRYRPPPPTVEVEGATVRFVPTPGHTDDHWCAWLEEEKALFTGDTVLGTGSSVFACYTDFMASLERLRGLHPSRLYPGHGPVVTEAVPYLTRYIAHRKEREQQILDALSAAATKAGDVPGAPSSSTASSSCVGGGAMSINELVQCIYTTTPPHLWPAAALNVFHHIKQLVHDNKVAVLQKPSISCDVFASGGDYSLLGEGTDLDKETVHEMMAGTYVSVLPEAKSTDVNK